MQDFQSLHQIPEYWAQYRPTSEAVRLGDRVVSHRDFAAQVAYVASYLSSLGLHRGDRVAYLGRNDDKQLLLFFACARIGLVLVLPNWRLSIREVHEVLQDADPGVIFSSIDCAWQIDGIRLPAPTRLLSSEVLNVGVGQLALTSPTPWHEIDTEDDLMLCYTSGSTGRPKGVRQSHRNWLAAISMVGEWKGGNWHGESRALCTLPFFHVAGLRSAVLAIACGGAVVFPEDTSAEALLTLIQRERITTMSVVPTLLKSLIEASDDPGASLASLETIFYGAAPMPSALLAQARAILQCAFVQTYGATETTGMALALDNAHHFPPCEKRSTCGKPLPGIEVSIRAEDGRPLAQGQHGQVWLRGPSIAHGYWKQEATTNACFVDGWFVPGDLGRLDADGFLVLEGRSSDVIKTGGEKVFPNEVERVLLEHPGIADAAVYALPDPKWGERVCATIVPIPGAVADPEHVIAFCRDRLAAFKIPRQIDTVPALPRNSGGKVLRKMLQSERLALEQTLP